MPDLFPFPPEQTQAPLPDPIPESLYARPPTATQSKMRIHVTRAWPWWTSFPRGWPAWKQVMVGVAGLIGVIFFVQTPRSAALGFLGCLTLITALLASDAGGLRRRVPLLRAENPRVAGAGWGVIGVLALVAAILALTSASSASSSRQHISRLVAPPFQTAGPSPLELTPSPTPTPTPTSTPLAARRPPPKPTLAAVTFLGAPLSAQGGETVTLAVRTAPNTDCSIDVAYPSGPALDPATSDSAGNVSWTWRVGRHVPPGSWPITVSCRAGAASTRITVS